MRVVLLQSIINVENYCEFLGGETGGENEGENVLRREL
jgi:hypothetical protein